MARFSLRLPPALVAALLALCLLGPATSNASSSTPPTPTVTTAPIFLPYYEKDQWSIVRGSILSKNKTASETTYTIFCPTQPPTCDLSLEFPFVVVEGPSTLKFHGTWTSTYIADLECNLDGTTAATCSGYSSYASGYTNGQNTGPTEVSWTSTLSGSAVEWATLTLAEKPKATDNGLDVTGTDIAAPVVASSALSYPSTTAKSAAAGTRADGALAIVATVASLIAARIVL